MLNNALTRFFGFKQYLNDIFCLNDTHTRKIMLRLVYSHTSLLILFIFDPKRENLTTTRMVRDLKRMRQVTMNETRLKQNKICNNLSHTEQRKSCPNSMILKWKRLEWSNFPENLSLARALSLYRMSFY
jgi:hypothetical protein